MKFWNINICLTSRKSIMVIISLLLSTIVIASVWPNKIIVIEEVIPESQRGGNVDLASIGLILGFIVMMILDVSLG